MKKGLVTLGLMGVALLGSYGLYEMGNKPKTEKRPPDAIREMKYPDGFKVKGDPATGLLCHQVDLCVMRDGSWACRTIRIHDIEGRDFRNVSEETAKRWLEEDALRDAAEDGLACGGDVDDGFFRAAYAQPTCLDCGGGCGAVTCPATLIGGGIPCQIPGTTCAITKIYCGGPLPPGCA